MKHFTRRIIALILPVLLATGASAQDEIRWDGGGTSTDWDDAANWAGDVLPTAEQIAVFYLGGVVTEYTVTGSNATAPAGLKVNTDVTDDSKAVYLNGNFNIGNANPTLATKGTVIIDPKGKLVVGDGGTLTIQSTTGVLPAIDLDGTLEVSGTINIPGTTDQIGVDARNVGSLVTIKNGGVINVSGGKLGFSCYLNGGFTQAADFLIEAGGEFNVSGTTDHAIFLQDGYTMVNYGEINISSDGMTDVDKYAMEIADETSSFKNMAGGELSIVNTGEARSISLKSGAITNAGVMNMTGGASYKNSLILDDFTNEVGGIINLNGDNQIRLNDAANAVFTNNGYIKSNGEGSVFNLVAESGAAINNAFYYYANKDWPSTDNGSLHQDNGVEVDANGDFEVDPSGSATFNVGIKTAYDWFEEAANTTAIGSNDASGAVTLTPTADCDFTFYTSYGDLITMTVVEYEFGSTCTGIITMAATNGSVTLAGTTVGTSGIRYPLNQVNAYTAVPEVGYEFKDWTFSNGTATTTANPLNYTITKDETITANFRLLNYDITVATPANGTVELSGSTIDNTPNNYDANTQNVYTAVSASGYRFVSWAFSGATAESTANPLTYTVLEDETITAVFELVPEQFDISVVSDNGLVTKDGVTAASGPVVTDKDAMSEYEATPAFGYEFVNWTFSGSTETTTDNPMTYTAKEDEVITANFSSIMFTIVAKAVNGTVTPEAGQYAKGVPQTFTATPAADAKFVGWFGDVEGTELSITVTPNQNMTLTALFEIPLSTEDLTIDHQSSIYPVPVRNEGFNIDLSNVQAKGDLEVKLFSTQGQVVYQKRAKAGQKLFVQRAAAWQTGLYLVSITGKDHQEVKRITIQ
ncbi:T9SS type A sorting domain-containing protein [Reichenbachiella carrageenanivorans]|uniref:T9SS type A sorting domain-containing protein n=1 Tax=Reichenbachiella carrageenanivorans TaxID=2979869 RepID=A0ABY6D6Q9_9BACT|nr:T9SS type A sorting domain-containing protein [Reichenbachiella carrageenanivorans]UXX81300.1 T9SS type A sorting domain-containing protein [Reichenbachiella carrageenanivorans]